MCVYLLFMKVDKLTSTFIGKAQLRNETKRSILFAGFIAVLSILLHSFVSSSGLTLFILLFLVERVYESFFKVQKCADAQLSQDKHLNRIIAAFSVMVLSAVLEFYVKSRPIMPAFTYVGFLLLLGSF